MLVLSGLWVPAPGLAQPLANGGKPGKLSNFNANKGYGKMMERFRTKLEVTNDQEWSIIQQRIERVMRAQREVQNGVYAKRLSNGNAGGEAENLRLRKLVEGKAPAKEIRASVARVREMLKQKQADLDTAQEDLRSVLTPRQEAIAILNGWLR